MKEKIKPLLSIIIPTYNRASLLPFTLSLFKEQITRNVSDVELIVCSNVCTDNTIEVLQEYHKKNPFFNIKKYDKYEEGGDVVVRSTENANGKYFMIFGDDDIPSPFMVDALLNSIKKHPDVGEILINRLVGRRKEDSLALESIYLIGTTEYFSGEIFYTDFSTFVEEHQHEIGFAPIHVVRTEFWGKHYQDVYPNEDFGFEWMAPFLYSTMKAPALYIQYPLCIQGRPSLSNKNAAHDFQGLRAFKYFKIGYFRAIKHLGELGIIEDVKRSYDKQIYGNGDRSVSLVDNRRSFYFACVDWTDEIKEYVDELCEYQSDEELKLMLKRLLMSKKQKLWRIYYRNKLYGHKWMIGYPWRQFKRLLKKVCGLRFFKQKNEI